jgi:hypothetical protein
MLNKTESNLTEEAARRARIPLFVQCWERVMPLLLYYSVPIYLEEKPMDFLKCIEDIPYLLI